MNKNKSFYGSLLKSCAILSFILFNQIAQLSIAGPTTTPSTAHTGASNLDSTSFVTCTTTGGVTTCTNPLPGSVANITNPDGCQSVISTATEACPAPYQAYTRTFKKVTTTCNGEITGTSNGADTIPCPSNYTLTVDASSANSTNNNNAYLYSTYPNEAAIDCGMGSQVSKTACSSQYITTGGGNIPVVSLGVYGSLQPGYQWRWSITGATCTGAQLSPATNTSPVPAPSCSSPAGEVICNGSSCSIKMDKDRTVSFIVEKSLYNPVSVEVTGAGTVTATGINCRANFTPDCYEHLAVGSEITLTASADSGNTFQSWGGAAASCGSNLTCTLIASDVTNATASFYPVFQYTLSVSKMGTGSVTGAGGLINCGSTCTAVFESGTNVSLTATPEAGSTFTGWSGACTGTGTCLITMNASKSVVANFNAYVSNNYTLTTANSGSGASSGNITSSPAGITCGTSGTDCTENYSSGASVTLTAGTPPSNAAFLGWSGDGSSCDTNQTCTISMSTSNKYVVANWARRYTVTVTNSNTAAGTVTGTEISCGTGCVTTLNSGSSITLTAAPTGTYQFTGWSGDAAFCGTNLTCTVTVDSNKNIGANFSVQNYTLTVSMPGTTVDNNFDARITSNSPVTNAINCGVSASYNLTTCSVSLPANSTVTLNLDGNPKYSYKWRWDATGATCAGGMASPAPGVYGANTPIANPTCTGNGFSCSGRTCTITLNGNKTIAAPIESLTTHSVLLVSTTETAGAGTVTSTPTAINCSNGMTGTCAQHLTAGSSITLTATPGAGYKFVGWGGDGSSCGLTTTCAVTMSTNYKFVAANFAPLQTFTLNLNNAGGGAPRGAVASNPAGLSCSNTTSSCFGTFAHSTNVTLTATPDIAYKVASWSGDVSCGAVNSCAISMVGDKSVTVNWVAKSIYTLTVNNNGGSGSYGSIAATPTPLTGSIGCAAGAASCNGNYYEGSTVTLTATPNTGYQVTSWTNCDSSSGNTCTVNLNASRTVTANYAAIVYNRNLTVTFTGANATSPTNNTAYIYSNSPVNGAIACGVGSNVNNTNCTETYTYSATNVPTITLAMTGEVHWGYAWRWNISGATCTTTGGILSPPYNSFGNTQADPLGGTTTCTGPGISCSGNTCSIVMDQNRTINADLFIPNPKALVTYSVGTNTGTGTILSSVAGINCTALPSGGFSGDCLEYYTPNLPVSITAYPAVGNVFEGWVGTCAGAPTTCNLTMNVAHAIGAKFRALGIYNLTVNNNGNQGSFGSVTAAPAPISGSIGCAAGAASCSGNYYEGTSVTLTSTPNTGYQITGWTGCDSVSGNTCTVTMNAARSVTVSYAAIIYNRNLTVSFTGANATSPTNANGYIYSNSPVNGAILCGVSSTYNYTNCTETYTYSATNVPTVTLVMAGTPHWGYAWRWNISGATCSSGAILSPPYNSMGNTQADPMGNTTCTGPGISCSGTTCTVTMDQDRTINADLFIPAYKALIGYNPNGAYTGTGTLTASLGGFSCTITSGGATSGDCLQYYTTGQSNIVTATQAAGNQFINWEGGTCTGTSTTCNLTTNGAVAVGARFNALTPYTLTVNSAGIRGIIGSITATPSPVSGAINCGATCSAIYYSGTVVTLTAPATPGEYVQMWTGCDAVSGSIGEICTVNMTSARTVQATWNLRRHTLTINTPGSSAGNNYNAYVYSTNYPGAINCVNSNQANGTLTQCSNIFAYTGATPATVNLAVSGIAHWLNHWRWDIPGATCSGAEPSPTPGTNGINRPYPAPSCTGPGISCSGFTCSIVMDQNRTVNMVVEYSGLVMINANTAGSDGTITTTAPNAAVNCYNGTNGTCMQFYSPNTNVTFVATPAAGRAFTGWGGDAAGCGTNPTCTVYVNSYKTITANFVNNISVTGGVISSSGGYTYHTFNSSGTLTLTGGNLTMDILIVGGGGAGGSYAGGGGGGGGVQVVTGFTLTPQAVGITVGAGGVFSNMYNGGTGGNSAFGGYYAYGGGGGGSGYYGAAGQPGGSGGGGGGGNGSGNTYSYGAGAMAGYGGSFYGYGGGNGYWAYYGGGGGGGGAGGPGSSGYYDGYGSSGGNGGAALNVWGYLVGGGGGGGGSVSYGGNTQALGGSGIGGNGEWSYGGPTVGYANRGGGGGGSRGGGGAQSNGGAGVVVIRYPNL